MTLRDLNSALRMLVLLTIGGWFGFMLLGKCLLLLWYGELRASGEGDRYDAYGALLGMLLALAVHLGRRWRTADATSRPVVQRDLLVMAAISLVFATYLAGYISTGWLLGRGLMSQPMKIRLEQTVYLPITAGLMHEFMPAWDLHRLQRRAHQLGQISARRSRG